MILFGRGNYTGGRLASLLIDYADRIILIRDIRKNFYVTGINEKFNSIDSVLDMLGDLIRGLEIVAAGGSAGGYRASIIGSNLNAKFVISHWRNCTMVCLLLI